MARTIGMHQSPPLALPTVTWWELPSDFRRTGVRIRRFISPLFRCWTTTGAHAEPRLTLAADQTIHLSLQDRGSRAGSADAHHFRLAASSSRLETCNI